jgi:hypothetical protein
MVGYLCLHVEVPPFRNKMGRVYHLNLTASRNCIKKLHQETSLKQAEQQAHAHGQ